jgi:chromosome segregation ATPase
VASAERKVDKEEKDLAEARHEAMKPTITDDDAARNVDKQAGDVAEARGELNQKEREYQATQARDALLADAQKVLDAADQHIDSLKSRAKSEEGATKDATQVQIDDLQTQRDHLSDAMSTLKKTELTKWNELKPQVEKAMKDLNAKLQSQR